MFAFRVKDYDTTGSLPGFKKPRRTLHLGAEVQESPGPSNAISAWRRPSSNPNYKGSGLAA